MGTRPRPDLNLRGGWWVGSLHSALPYFVVYDDLDLGDPGGPQQQNAVDDPPLLGPVPGCLGYGGRSMGWCVRPWEAAPIAFLRGSPRRCERTR
jgi:hypothetical protein